MRGRGDCATACRFLEIQTTAGRRRVITTLFPGTHTRLFITLTTLTSGQLSEHQLHLCLGAPTNQPASLTQNHLLTPISLPLRAPPPYPRNWLPPPATQHLLPDCLPFPRLPREKKVRKGKGRKGEKGKVRMGKGRIRGEGKENGEGRGRKGEERSLQQ